jgi:predicted permease
MKRVFRLSRLVPDVQDDVADEIRFYLDMRTQEFIAAGLPPQEAGRKALEAFGDVGEIERECREVAASRVRQRQRSELIESIWQDLRYAVRTLRKSPGFTVAVILTLALGIGANTALFSVLHGVLLRPLPYTRGDRLVVVQQEPRLLGTGAGFSVPEVLDYRQQNATLSTAAEYHSMWFNLLGRAEPERVQTGVVSADFFDLLGVRPILGRTFHPEDDRPGAEPVLILSHEYWKRAFGGDPAVVGRALTMNDRPHTVVGVLPPVPQYPHENHVYMPTSACPFRSGDRALHARDVRITDLQLYGRLRDGVTLDSARADIALIGSRLQRQYPEAYPRSSDFTTVLSLEQELTRSFRPMLFLLTGTAGFVLLIVCASVANLSLARLLRRERELAIRAAVGADRARLLRQLLTESMLLALVGGAVGLALAAGTLDLLVAFAARFTVRAGEIGIDGPVLLFTLAMSLGTGLVFGALPALSSRQNLAGALNEGSGRATADAGKHRVRNALIVAQVAVSFMLLVGAGLMIRSLMKLQRVDPGFRAERVLTMTMDLDFVKHATPALRAQFFGRLLERTDALPGVMASAVSGTFPLHEKEPAQVRFRIEGRPVEEGRPLPRAALRVASPAYFGAVGIPLLQGRLFTDQDRLGAPEMVIVNQTMAHHYWGAEDPTGKRLIGEDGQGWFTIIGVVGDAKQRLDGEVGDELYRPYAQLPLLSTTLLVRTPGDPEAMARRVAEAVYSVDPEQPVADVRTLGEVRAQALASPRLTAILLGLFAALALTITATGIAGVVAFSVSQRTPEIGIRIALGAQRGDILRAMVSQGFALVLAGLALGLAGALTLTRLVADFLFGIGAADPLTYAAVSLVLIAVAAAACLVPAWRATGINPTIALRAGE